MSGEHAKDTSFFFSKIDELSPASPAHVINTKRMERAQKSLMDASRCSLKRKRKKTKGTAGISTGESPTFISRSPT